MKPSKRKSPPRSSAKSADAHSRRESQPPEGGTPNAPHPQIVLLAVTGMSPAILTETIWALAQESTPVIPDRVVVITTTQGRDAIEQNLFRPSKDFGGPCVWDALRARLTTLGHDSAGRLQFGTTGGDIRVFSAPDPLTGRSRELDDIRTPEDNQAAADLVLDEVRRITFNDDTRLIASLAGGRKTMGALLYAALSLLGRPQDRLTHVLVNEPFDDPRLAPRFYFPLASPVSHQLTDRAGKVVSEHTTSAADPRLADVPFVRLRNLFPRQLGRWPGRFNALVQIFSERVDQLAGPPEVHLASNRPVMVVNGVSVELSAREYSLYAYMLDRLRRAAPTNILQKDCLDELTRFLPAWTKQFPELSFQRDAVAKWKNPIDDDLRRQFSSLRAKFTIAGLKPHLSNLLPVRGRFGLNVRCADTDI